MWVRSSSSAVISAASGMVRTYEGSAGMAIGNLASGSQRNLKQPPMRRDSRPYIQASLRISFVQDGPGVRAPKETLMPSRSVGLTLCLLIVAAPAFVAPDAAAQSVQYRPPAGVEYRSQPDTGAVARAEQALAADPRNVALVIQLGVAQSGVRRYREGNQTFTRGLAIAPNDPMLYRWRGHRYLSVREFRSEERRVGK